ncbi:BICD family-like cargo adapter 2 [Spea bombifrons]|uniref:BICD family-like cargo adapter 2 n=1 Tax=Spea bombifrons TaxID=233779 RepID=UPI00234ABB5D|nr:BICD family-like cargo adapter 2 [Spea bombifrons]XP_053327211.1 BICD family-like cargo adapter 2 [Spea bombifrons]XP_053327212.1 BICD family-like cargo adapter 2 [Spea bombifrons]XP_053327213.1 BICD family-like cargo adapter 2 [Spea bombifrons]XP_053327214.1 BICD family-like cargo adapter 2 [Spea bombifrons]
MTSGGTESRGGVPRGWNGGLASPSMEEHFYPFLLERRPSYLGEEDEEQGEEDLRLALERKEKDLLLAAELGKALLERNDQLERGREALEEELRETRERLEQEKHNMRLKMEAQEGEWRAQVADLESDLAEARLQMKHFVSEQRECGRETATAVQELSEQNQRLLEQMAQVSQLEQSLTSQIQSLKEENRELTLSRGHLAPCLQSLQSENALLLQKKRDLELQIKQLREENESAQNMVFTLKETALQFERKERENNLKMQQLQVEAQDLRDSQRKLQSQVRELQEEQHMRDSQHSMQDRHYSLHSEIQQSTSGMEHEIIPPCGSAFLSSAVSPQPGAAGAADGLLYLSQREGELLREKEEEVARLRDQVTQQYIELESLREELQRRRDVSQQNDRDAILRQALSERDDAIMKKGELEMELANCCRERDTLNGQLMNVVQQKVLLSQELEAWQEDMQVVINQQLKSQKETQKEGETSPLTPRKRESARRPRDAGGGILSFLIRN